ncbi:nucleoside 2-deoxyribosyltransferase domain-containing protein [archaeon]|nr:nucleoside 2-deoxyribosyltransferase domain-containing protein [archaeon]
MTRLIVPANYLKSLSHDSPMIFLAGPIQGAPKWQFDATKYIISHSNDIYVASPRRLEEFQEGKFTKEMYNKQVDWETFHLRRAAKNGAVLFWLAKEKDHKCYRAYAQTSRFELAEWKMWHEVYGINFVVGIEEGFTGSKYIRRRFSQDCPDRPILSTLEETCQVAMELSHK